MSYGRVLLYDVMRSRDSATFTGSYQTLGSVLSHPSSIIKIVNDSNVLVTISVDGVNDHDILPSGSFTLYDATSNSPNESGSIYAEKGRQYYIKGSASTGLVYLVVQYISQV